MVKAFVGNSNATSGKYQEPRDIKLATYEQYKLGKLPLERIKTFCYSDTSTGFTSFTPFVNTSTNRILITKLACSIAGSYAHSLSTSINRAMFGKLTIAFQNVGASSFLTYQVCGGSQSFDTAILLEGNSIGQIVAEADSIIGTLWGTGTTFIRLNYSITIEYIELTQ
jgi:hypothetical protein